MDYTTLADNESIERTKAGVTGRGLEVSVVETGKDALAMIKELIPAGASVMNGTSATLEQIGYIEYLKSGAHPWVNPKVAILAETDKAKQSVLRKQSVVSDYYLGSVHAISETGELVFGSNSGSQLPHIVFTSQNLIFVASTAKICPTLDAAMARLRDYVVPLEDERVKKAGAPGTKLSKIVIFNHEPSFLGRTVRLILVKEVLGF